MSKVLKLKVQQEPNRKEKKHNKSSSRSRSRSAGRAPGRGRGKRQAKNREHKLPPAATAMVRKNLGRAPGCLRELVLQMIDPMAGARVRLPATAAGTSPATALMTNFQVDSWTIPSDYNTLVGNLVPQILTLFNSGSSTPQTIPLWDLSRGIPFVHLWDPMFPVIRPAFNVGATPIAYAYSQFTGPTGPNVGYGQYVVPYVENSATPQMAVTSLAISPGGGYLTSGSAIAGNARPVLMERGLTWFWMDSATVLNVTFRPYYYGTAASTVYKLDVLLRDENGNDSILDSASSSTLSNSGVQLSINFPNIITSGWFRLELSALITLAAAAPNTIATIQDFWFTTTNSLPVQTNFMDNPTTRGMATNITSVRMLGSSLLGHCTSPQFFKGGTISAIAGHNVTDDWTRLSSNPSSIDSTAHPSYYNGNFVTPPGSTSKKEDGGLYSILCPKNYGAFPESAYSSDTFRTSAYIHNINISAVALSGKSFGYNLIHLRPEFVSTDSSPDFKFQLICAQTIEFTTRSQAFQCAKTKATFMDWGLLMDTVSKIYPFSANPAHTSKIAQILRAVGTVGEVILPVGAAIAMAAANPEVAAILGVATAGAAKLSDYQD